jgi:hypothetical protein
MPKKLDTFKVDDKEYAILDISAELGRKALAEYNRAFSSAVKSGAVLRATLQNILKEQGVWSEAKQKQYEELTENIGKTETKLAKGGIKLKEARELAINLRRYRAEVRDLISERSQLDSNTAEGQAENARFNYLVASATVDNETGKPIFKDLDDYIQRGNDEVASEAARRLAHSLYQFDIDYEKGLPENKFLKKWGFVNDDLHLVRKKDGKLIDVEGRLVDENGRYVDEDGKFVDIDGNPLTEDGELAIEGEPFLDDDGNPLEEPED